MAVVTKKCYSSNASKFMSFISILELAMCLLVEEIVFFYSHWLLHHRLIYKHIHKVMKHQVR